MKIETDPKVIQMYTNKTGKRVGLIYKSEFNTLLVDLIKFNDGSMTTYERIVPTVEFGAVVVVPIFQNKFVLLKQFRHSMRDIQYAFPRGFGEPNTSSIENAKKEINEEIGSKVLSITYLGNVIADSGLSGNSVSVYTVEVTEPKSGKFDEGIQELVYLSNNKLKSWIKQKRITDGFTLSAYCLYATTH